MYEFFFGGSLENPPLIYELGVLGIAFLIGGGALFVMWLKSRADARRSE